ncbi:MAG: hypothetical protein Q7J06_10965 [Bacteroidales bacterium]|nr:hypothetical protein [Bacteroidales bacterium]
MSPGMPQTAVKIGDRIGSIMNYGDGIYGGLFVAALYSDAFFNNDILSIIENALKSIPAESDYFKIIKDVIKLHEHYPSDWEAAWKEIEAKWDNVDERLDIALWIDQKGQWKGVIQGLNGEIPKALTEITGNWSRLNLPELPSGTGS